MVILLTETNRSVPVDQIQQLLLTLQKKNEEQFKHLNRKLEMRLGSGKVFFIVREEYLIF